VISGAMTIWERISRAEVTEELSLSAERDDIPRDKCISHFLKDRVGETTIRCHPRSKYLEVYEACDNEQNDETEDSAVDTIPCNPESIRNTIVDIEYHVSVEQPSEAEDRFYIMFTRLIKNNAYGTR
jgi:hypothetical protein